MSNVFIKCTLDDPKQECDLRLERDQNGCYVDLGDQLKVYEAAKLELELIDLGHPQIPTEIKVLTTEVHKNGQESPVSHKQSLGYIPEVYVKYLAPLLNKDTVLSGRINDFFEATIHRIDTNACGSDGITIKICIK